MNIEVSRSNEIPKIELGKRPIDEVDLCNFKDDLKEVLEIGGKKSSEAGKDYCIYVLSNALVMKLPDMQYFSVNKSKETGLYYLELPKVEEEYQWLVDLVSENFQKFYHDRSVSILSKNAKKLSQLKKTLNKKIKRLLNKWS